ncbi:MAG TPA: CAP domain-containing protein [Bacteroidales bacterium]|nr:CAP domain-containing protein [Bacteroidales bacterium]HQG37365.1 CAP domain-containing protein [Bacteroidales bacterium]HQG52002.1 CAP domain-containing protein [Bacteroidales bacterium]HQJ19698.1 CAP domain-containing protein [Bacteroidales bacterium]
MKINKVFCKIFFFILFIVTQKTNAQQTSDFEYYKMLNNNEKRLYEYRDDDNNLRLKLIQLDIINKSRKRHNAPPVKLDILASRVANMMSREAAENGYISHWNMKGEKPYHRYAFAGGYDHVSENAYGEWTSGRYDKTNEIILELMKNGHESFMSEKAPSDGHKRNIIDKFHNYVGIGFYISENQFRYYEEFINRYLDFQNIPSVLPVNEKFILQADTHGESFLYFLLCYREKFPVALKEGQKPRQGSYDDFSDEITLRIPAWELSKYREGTIYKIPLSFSKEGLYYIQVFTDKNEITTLRQISTKGRPPVSGIVIRIMNPTIR